MKKYKYLFLAISAIFAGSANAQTLSKPIFVVDSCAGSIGVNPCTYRELGQPSKTQPNNNSTPSSADLNGAAMAAAGAGMLTGGMTQEQMNKVMQNKPVQGSYNSSVPGGNPFVFCSGGRPSRKNPLRPIYDSICPSGQTTPEQAMQKNGHTEHVADAKNLQQQLAKVGTSAMEGVAVSSAAAIALGAQVNTDGTSSNVNNMSYNNYNRQLYNQINHEDYLRKQEQIKAALDPEYIPQVIPNSKNYNLNQTNIVQGQQQELNDLLQNNQQALKNLPSPDAVGQAIVNHQNGVSKQVPVVQQSAPKASNTNSTSSFSAFK